jgi:hypothetical protein
MSDEWPIEEFFDEDYLHFAAPYLADDTTDAEAALVWTLLALPAGAEILDLACCGCRKRVRGRGEFRRSSFPRVWWGADASKLTGSRTGWPLSGWFRLLGGTR